MNEILKHLPTKQSFYSLQIHLLKLSTNPFHLHAPPTASQIATVLSFCISHGEVLQILPSDYLQLQSIYRASKSKPYTNMQGESNKDKQNTAEEQVLGCLFSHLPVCSFFLKRTNLDSWKLLQGEHFMQFDTIFFELTDFLRKVDHSPQFLGEQSQKYLIFEIILQAPLSQVPPHFFWIISAAKTGLVAVEEADCREDEGPHVPNGGPCLLVEVGKGCTDGHIALKAAAGSVEEEFRRREGIIRMQLQQSVVIAPAKGRVEIDQTEMKMQQTVSNNNGFVQRLALKGSFLLLQSQNCQSLYLHLSIYNIIQSTYEPWISIYGATQNWAEFTACSAGNFGESLGRRRWQSFRGRRQAHFTSQQFKSQQTYNSPKQNTQIGSQKIQSNSLSSQLSVAQISQF